MLSHGTVLLTQLKAGILEDSRGSGRCGSVIAAASVL